MPKQRTRTSPASATRNFAPQASWSFTLLSPRTRSTFLIMTKHQILRKKIQKTYSSTGKRARDENDKTDKKITNKQFFKCELSTNVYGAKFWSPSTCLASILFYSWENFRGYSDKEQGGPQNAPRARSVKYNRLVASGPALTFNPSKPRLEITYAWL